MRELDTLPTPRDLLARAKTRARRWALGRLLRVPADQRLVVTHRLTSGGAELGPWVLAVGHLAYEITDDGRLCLVYEPEHADRVWIDGDGATLTLATSMDLGTTP